VISVRYFVHSGGYDGGSFAQYARQRLLGVDPRFQQSPEYVFWLLETWLKSQVSAQTCIRVAPATGQRGGSGRQQLLNRVYAVLRGVAGTQPYMYAKRAMTMRMFAQLGRPSFFLTLTSHELQPYLLLACAVAHIRSKEERGCAAYNDQVLTRAAGAVDVLMNQSDTWEDFTATTLCAAYPATITREFMRMLRDMLRWLAPDRDDEGDGTHAGTACNAQSTHR